MCGHDQMHSLIRGHLRDDVLFALHIVRAAFEVVNLDPVTMLVPHDTDNFALQHVLGTATSDRDGSRRDLTAFDRTCSCGARAYAVMTTTRAHGHAAQGQGAAPTTSRGTRPSERDARSVG